MVQYRHHSLVLPKRLLLTICQSRLLVVILLIQTSWYTIWPAAAVQTPADRGIESAGLSSLLGGACLYTAPKLRPKRLLSPVHSGTSSRLCKRIQVTSRKHLSLKQGSKLKQIESCFCDWCCRWEFHSAYCRFSSERNCSKLIAQQQFAAVSWLIDKTRLFLRFDIWVLVNR